MKRSTSKVIDNKLYLMLILSILLHANLLIGLNEFIDNDYANKTKQVLTVNLSKTSTLSTNKTQNNSDSINVHADNLADKNSKKLSQAITKKREVVENKFHLDSPIYYTVSELDVVPAPLTDISQDLPQLDQFHSSGNLEIQLWLDMNGTVEDAKVIKTELPDDLTRVFLANFLALKFTEAIKNKEKVKSTLKITLNITN